VRQPNQRAILSPSPRPVNLIRTIFQPCPTRPAQRADRRVACPS
jgi:hypothetical protein